MKTLKAETIVLTALQPKEGKSFYKIIEGEDFFLISPKVYELCKNYYLDEVHFVENDKIEVKDNDGNVIKTFKSWKVSRVTETRLAQNKREMVFLESDAELIAAKTSVSSKRKEYESLFGNLKDFTQQ
jgi:hypothetical protein